MEYHSIFWDIMGYDHGDILVNWKSITDGTLNRTIHYIPLPHLKAGGARLNPFNNTSHVWTNSTMCWRQSKHLVDLKKINNSKIIRKSTCYGNKWLIAKLLTKVESQSPVWRNTPAPGPPVPPAASSYLGSLHALSEKTLSPVPKIGRCRLVLKVIPQKTK